MGTARRYRNTYNFLAMAYVRCSEIIPLEIFLADLLTRSIVFCFPSGSIDFSHKKCLCPFDNR